MGKLEEGNRSEEFLIELKDVWETKRYKDKKKCRLLQALVRTSIWRIIVVIISSFISMGLDIFQVILFREYISLYESNDKSQGDFSLLQLGIFFLASKIISSLINKQVSVSQVT